MGSTDSFGFKKEDEFDRDHVEIEEQEKKNDKKITLILFWIAVGIASLILLVMTSFTGYLAWNEFVNDPIWVKCTKTWLAILFSPIFLFYLFCKSIIFDIKR